MSIKQLGTRLGLKQNIIDTTCSGIWGVEKVH